jgi:hypothetical protein
MIMVSTRWSPSAIARIVLQGNLSASRKVPCSVIDGGELAVRGEAKPVRGRARAKSVTAAVFAE